MTETGHISIHAENILPIIKRWLYSEKEIFLRELISNSADAILKLQKLALIGEVARELPEARIDVKVDKSAKQIIISDTGLGLTAEDMKRYINQVAFSGLHDFLDKYKDKDDSQQVIGHFGLGFYSSFMVAHKVEIESLSYQEGAQAAHWRCDGSTEFTITKGTRTEVGTDIILSIAADSEDLLEEGKLRELLQRYCAFLRYPIYLGGEVVNDPTPLWTRSPSELTDQDYKDFFQKLFPFSPEPLLWIHLNVDYPFNLKGILYFPKLKHELDASQGEVKLYCNQVYVADNTKELIPEFLTLLKGAIDCPDLPLNVSRSYLQNEPTVRKISEHITKKVADKLTGLAKTEREAYEKFWGDISPFIKFGMLRDHKFYERMQEHLIFKSSNSKGSQDVYVTLAQYHENMKDKVDEGTVLYCSDQIAQTGYLRLLRDHGMEAIIADTMIDQHFLPYLEMESGRKHKFMRVDAHISSHLLDSAGSASKVVDPTDNKTATEKLTDLFKKYLGNEKLEVRVETFKSDKVPAMLILDENKRRLKDMSRYAPLAALQGALGDQGVGETLVVNQKSPAVLNLLQLAKSFNREEEVRLVAQQIYDLASLQHGGFTAEKMQDFIDRSTAILGRLGKTESILT
jgi:molecular chaperone HtpG